MQMLRLVATSPSSLGLPTKRCSHCIGGRKTFVRNKTTFEIEDANAWFEFHQRMMSNRSIRSVKSFELHADLSESFMIPAFTWTWRGSSPKPCKRLFGQYDHVFLPPLAWKLFIMPIYRKSRLSRWGPSTINQAWKCRMPCKKSPLQIVRECHERPVVTQQQQQL